MTYEVAKQLKDAGFPQRLKDSSVAMTADGEVPINQFELPTLSELIEACGTRFAGVYKAEHSEGWNASSLWSDLTKNAPSADGSPPEAAVANLWLALNKK